MIKIFQAHGLKLEIKYNFKKANVQVDITFDLNTGSYSPYRKPRISKNLAGRLMDSWIFFSFGFLWCSSFVINFPRILKRLFRPMKILLPRHSKSNYQISLYKLNLMCEELSNKIINTSAVNQAAFCYH